MLPEQIASGYQRRATENTGENPSRPYALAVDCQDAQQSENKRKARIRYDASGKTDSALAEARDSLAGRGGRSNQNVAPGAGLLL